MRRQRWQRFARTITGIGNPLQRRVDRVQWAIMAGLVVAFLIAAPLSSIGAVQATGAAAAQQRRSEASWHRVTAVLVQSAAAGQIVQDGTAEASWVTAHWTAPDGVRRTGLVAVSLRARRGQRIAVWVTPSGQLMHPPLTRAQILQWEVMGGVTAPIGLAVLLMVAGGVVRVLANRRRMAGWARDWAVTGPRWSSLR
jgi:hypothetical protein